MTEFQYGDTECKGSIMRTSNPVAECSNITIARNAQYNTAKCGGPLKLPQILGCKNKCDDPIITSCVYNYDQQSFDKCNTLPNLPVIATRQVIASCSPSKTPDSYAAYQEFTDSECKYPLWYPHIHTLTSCFTRFQGTSESMVCDGDYVNKTTYLTTSTCDKSKQTTFIRHKVGSCEKRTDLLTSDVIYVKYTECKIKPLSNSGMDSILSWILTFVLVILY